MTFKNNKIHLKQIIHLSFFVFISTCAFSQEKNRYDDSLISFKKNTSSQIIKRKGYVLAYDTLQLKTYWVYYLHTNKKSEKVVSRSNHFKTDSFLKSKDIYADYKNSGFDRGHLAPAGDMCYDSITMKESFYYSNISPQTPSFNRGVWKLLEEKTRYWVGVYDSIYIIIGPIFNQGCQNYIGVDSIPIPVSFYKILLNKRGNQYVALAFEIPNLESKQNLASFVVSIDALEQKTKIDFFPFLPDEHENLLERIINIQNWDFH